MPQTRVIDRFHDNNGELVVTRYRRYSASGKLIEGSVFMAPKDATHQEIADMHKAKQAEEKGEGPLVPAGY